MQDLKNIREQTQTTPASPNIKEYKRHETLFTLIKFNLYKNVTNAYNIEHRHSANI